VDDYVRRKVNFQNCDPCELGLAKYVQRMVERLRDAIVPDESEGEAPLMPITNRYNPIGTTAEVDFKTTRACHATMKSHIDQVVLDNLLWESSAGFRLESSDAVQFYARNDFGTCQEFPIGDPLNLPTQGTGLGMRIETQSVSIIHAHACLGVSGWV
jgi:type III restriction enzyme